MQRVLKDFACLSKNSHKHILYKKYLDSLLQHFKWDKVLKNGPSNFFKSCLPQILLGLFLNTLSQILAKCSSLFTKLVTCHMKLFRTIVHSCKDMDLDVRYARARKSFSVCLNSVLRSCSTLHCLS